MKTNTFLYIASAYGLLLGIPALFMPDFSLKYFGATMGDPIEQSFVNYLGMYQIGTAILGFQMTKSIDATARRAFLLALAFFTLIAVALQMYNLFVRDIPMNPTFYLDNAIWLTLGLASLYFWSKEKKS
jgi:hypothetical protein